MKEGEVYIYHGQMQLEMTEGEFYKIRKIDFKRVYLALSSPDGEDFGLNALILSKELIEELLEGKNSMGKLELVGL